MSKRGRMLIAKMDGELFKKGHTEMYLPELELGKENRNDTETTFSDLDIKII